MNTKHTDDIDTHPEPQNEHPEEMPENELEANEASAADTGADDTTVEMTEAEQLMLARDEFKAALQRERADFVNYRKRVEREKADMRTATTADTVAKFLPIVDDFDRAMAAAPDNAKEDGWMSGFALIHKKLHDLLNQLGVEPIDPEGEPFDPNYHEAIGSEDSDDYESGMVTAVLQKGYKLDNRCIRVAIVKVAN